jgi:hypothetical protein
MKKRVEDLRSHRWFGVDDLRAFGHRSRLAQLGFSYDDRAGQHRQAQHAGACVRIFDAQ